MYSLRENSFAPSVILQIRNHFACLDAFADGIGQRSFQAIAGIELDTTLVGDKQDDQSVVFAFLSHAPRVEQTVAEVEIVFIANAGNNGYDALYARLLLQPVKHTVDAVAGRYVEDVLGVGDVTGLVL